MHIRRIDYDRLEPSAPDRRRVPWLAVALLALLLTGLGAAMAVPGEPPAADYHYVD